MRLVWIIFLFLFFSGCLSKTGPVIYDSLRTQNLGDNINDIDNNNLTVRYVNNSVFSKTSAVDTTDAISVFDTDFDGRIDKIMIMKNGNTTTYEAK